MNRVYQLMFATLLGISMAYAADTQQTTDPATGLVKAGDWETVRNNCIACHSANLITQQHKDREGWMKLIRWMQDTQGLREFDAKTEDRILSYLAEHYGPMQHLQSGVQPLDSSLMPKNPYDTK